MNILHDFFFLMRYKHSDRKENPMIKIFFAICLLTKRRILYLIFFEKLHHSLKWKSTHFTEYLNFHIRINYVQI